MVGVFYSVSLHQDGLLLLLQRQFVAVSDDLFVKYLDDVCVLPRQYSMDLPRAAPPQSLPWLGLRS